MSTVATPPRPVSPARQLANARNAQKSTGPRTAEGKANSRRNALKHGLTGAGVVIPEDDAAEVERRTVALSRQMTPEGELGRILVQRLAVLSVRMERCVTREQACVSSKVRTAVADFEESRQSQVDALISALETAPRMAARRLRTMPEGVEWLASAYLDLKNEITHGSGTRWSDAHGRRLDQLGGLDPDAIVVSRIRALSTALLGDFTLLEPNEGGKDEASRRRWAREELVTHVDAAIDELTELYANLDHESLELDRLEAPQRALFDPSRDAELARKYEAAAERGFFRALREAQNLKKPARKPAANPPTPQPNPAPTPAPPAPRPEPLGSFFPAAVGPTNAGESKEIAAVGVPIVTPPARE
jgi:hypothetical protein